MDKLILSSVTFFSILLASAAQAGPLPDLTAYGNRWTITAYQDSSTSHVQMATQGICFYPAGTSGTQQLYYWVSDTYPDWNGRAAQEGDQVFMHGDFGRDVGHDAMQFELTTVSKADEAFGHWQEWFEDSRYGVTITFANTKLRRVGQCRWITFGEAILAAEKLAPKFTDAGDLLVAPGGLTEKQSYQLLSK